MQEKVSLKADVNQEKGQIFDQFLKGNKKIEKTFLIDFV
jgi:hypothetical protein